MAKRITRKKFEAAKKLDVWRKLQKAKRLKKEAEAQLKMGHSPSWCKGMSRMSFDIGFEKLPELYAIIVKTY